MFAEEVAEVRGETHKSHMEEYRTESGKVLYGATNCTSPEDNPLSGTENLIEKVVDRYNMICARDRVCSNKGAPGIDGRTVESLHEITSEFWQTIRDKILNGTYVPSPVKRIEIPKPQGGTRPLGIPTVLDRMIQQAIFQVLCPIFELEFSDSSYGFRPGRSAKQAIKAAQSYQKSGMRIVVDMDLKSFFDEVNHDILMGLLRKRVADKMLLKLIRAYLNAGIMIGGLCNVPEKGTPQGGPLSPLLSNIMLHELDVELEKRGHKFCRYADDCNIYVRTRRSGQRVLKSITNFVETRLKLIVNQEKSGVDHPAKRKFLGFTISYTGKIWVSKESKKRFKKKVIELCRKGRGQNLKDFIKWKLTPFLRGWFNYYKCVDEMKGFCEASDEWVRRRLRLILWRQWKRPWTRRCKLMALGLNEENAVQTAFNKRGQWYNSGTTHMNRALKNNYFSEKGLFSLLDHWKNRNETTI